MKYSLAYILKPFINNNKHIYFGKKISFEIYNTFLLRYATSLTH